jgi:hypothetical protein
MEQLVELQLAGKTEILRKNPAPFPLCPLQIPHGLTQQQQTE